MHSLHTHTHTQCSWMYTLIFSYLCFLVHICTFSLSLHCFPCGVTSLIVHYEVMAAILLCTCIYLSLEFLHTLVHFFICTYLWNMISYNKSCSRILFTLLHVHFWECYTLSITTIVDTVRDSRPLQQYRCTVNVNFLEGHFSWDWKFLMSNTLEGCRNIAELFVFLLMLFFQ